MYDPLKHARRLIQNKHLNDGLPELLIGSELLVLAASFWMQSILFNVRSVRIIGSPALLLIFVLLCVGATGIVQWIRRRFLMTRSGFVEIKRDRIKVKRTFLVLGTGIIVIAIIGTITRGLHPDHWILVAVGALFGATQMLFTRMPRFVINGIASFIVGILLSLTAVPIERGLAWFFSFVGLLSLFSGLIVFARFLRKPLKAA